MELSAQQRLDRLEAVEDIRKMISLYALGGDRRNDPAILGPLFSADAVWESEGFGHYEGRDNITAGLSTVAREQVLWSLHFPVAPIIDVQPDQTQASAFWWLWEVAELRDQAREEQSVIMGGTYEARFVRQGGRWLFSRIHLNFQTITPFREGWKLTGVNV